MSRREQIFMFFVATETYPLFDSMETQFLAVEYGSSLAIGQKSTLDAGWTAFIVLAVILVVVIGGAALYYFVVVPRTQESI